MTYLSVLRHSATIILAFTVSNLSKWAPRALNYRRSGVACVPPSAKFAIIKRPSTLNWSWLWGKGALAQFSVCSAAERRARPLRSFFFPCWCTLLYSMAKNRKKACAHGTTILCEFAFASFRLAPAKVVFRLSSKREVACLTGSMASSTKRQKGESKKDSSLLLYTAVDPAFTSTTTMKLEERANFQISLSRLLTLSFVLLTSLFALCLLYT